MITRRQAFQLTTGFAASSFLTLPARATTDLTGRTIRLLVGFQAGTSTDLLARVVAEGLRKTTGANVVVENMAGAGQVMAIQDLMRAAPDGHTLLLASGSALAQGPSVRRDLRYDPLVDFTPISLLGSNSGVIFTRADFPATSLAELIDYAKAHPDQLTYGSSGVGSASHLQVEYLAKVAGIKLVHVPYKSDTDPAIDASNGILDLGILNLRSILPFHEKGSLKPLVHIAPSRAAQIPQVATVAEAGVSGLEAMVPFSFFGLVGPKGLSPAMTQYIAHAIAALAEDKAYVTSLQDNLFIDPIGAAQTDLQDLIRSEIVKWSGLGIRIEA